MDKESKKVLIIDDEEDLRETVQYLFKGKGYQAETAFDGLDGLEKVDKVNPDLIILDVNMPRMNGLEFYEKIKGKDDKPKYPVLVLTARANMEELFKSLDVDGFMAKPFELEELLSEGEAIIRKYSSAVKLKEDSDEVRARTVCIVENDTETFKKIAVGFLEAGYIVNSSKSGASAIKRIKMDTPDIVVVSLGLKDISGDVVIFKLKRLDGMGDVRCLLYTSRSADKVEITRKISEKGGISSFVESVNPDDILEAADALFDVKEEEE